MTRIILIGAGKGGKALVELFHKDPTVEIAGVADKDAGAPGLVLARELGLRVSADYREFLTGKEDGLVMNCIEGRTGTGHGVRKTGDCGMAARKKERLWHDSESHWCVTFVTAVVPGRSYPAAWFLSCGAPRRPVLFLEQDSHFTLRNFDN